MANLHKNWSSIRLTLYFVVLCQLIQSSVGHMNLISKSQDNSTAEEIILETRLGSLKGYVLQSREERDYFAFYKVPYARPPIGDLRFKVPELATKWEGIRDEKEVGTQCIQKSKYSPIDEAVGDEDCLYMNIYTPKIPAEGDALLPTLFYIHGGGFVDGNGSRYGAKYFMDEDVVLITFQYRLGPFGFLSTEDGEIGGNMAFKDQIMGLKWVQENVEYFGGDPNRVMIFGNSAGGFSVSHLMISPMANGLFHTAITESGGSFCQALFGIDAGKNSFAALSQEMGCSSPNQTEAIECLRGINASDLAIVRRDDILYNLVIEDYETDDVANLFMPDTPYNMVGSGRVNRVPWIIGINSAESVGSSLVYLTDPAFIEALNADFTTVGSQILGIRGPEAESILTKAKELYFGDKRIGNETERNLTNLLSDRSFAHCSKVQASMQSQYSDVYLYFLTKEPEKSYADPIKPGFPPGEYGVSHADELQFIFNYNSYPEYPTNSSYYPFSRLLVKIWSDFATTGKPYAVNGTVWETVQPGQSPISWFELNEIPGSTTVLQSRMEFWDQFESEDLNYG